MTFQNQEIHPIYEKNVSSAPRRNRSSTAESAQRQGIGTELLSALEQKAFEEGYTFIRLNCNTVRTSAHAFYEHLHYVCDKTQKRFIKYIR